MSQILRFGAVIAFLGLVLPSAARPQETSSGVEVLRIPGVRTFPEATEAGAIQYACTDSQVRLAEFMASRNLEFQPKLMREHDGYRFCHIYYEPTVKGWRASTEDEQIRELFASVDPVSLLTGRKPVGDTFDTVKSVIAELPRPIDVTLSVNETFEPDYWPGAVARHFAGTRHRITVQQAPGFTPFTWAQDYLKSGEVDGKTVTLVPRRIYSGRADYDQRNGPMLDAFRDERFRRSKLSWEGGDLLLVRHPRQPEQRILFYGSAARAYWGPELTPKEYEYVLRTEFGADTAVNLSGLGGHIDYLVAFLPADNIALVAQFKQEDRAVAKSAVAELARVYEPAVPAALKQLIRIVGGPSEPMDASAVRNLIGTLRKTPPVFAPPEDPTLIAALERFRADHCPDRLDSCFEAEGQRAMLRSDPDVYRQFADARANQQLRELRAELLLDLIEGQMPDTPLANQKWIDDKAAQIRALGFRVIRVPYLISPDLISPGTASDWPGVSYLNLLASDGLLFVPTFGLGKAEDQIVAGLAKKLSGRYRVIPIDARFSLAHNGGVHCTFGIIRSAGLPPAQQPASGVQPATRN